MIWSVSGATPNGSLLKPNSREGVLLRELGAIGAREADEIAARFPKVQRRVGGYNLDALVPSASGNNFAHILVGSEGTLAVITAARLQLVPRPAGLVTVIIGLDGPGAVPELARAARA